MPKCSSNTLTVTPLSIEHCAVCFLFYCVGCFFLHKYQGALAAADTYMQLRRDWLMAVALPLVITAIVVVEWNENLSLHCISWFSETAIPSFLLLSHFLRTKGNNKKFFFLHAIRRMLVPVVNIFVRRQRRRKNNDRTLVLLPSFWLYPTTTRLIYSCCL